MKRALFLIIAFVFASVFSSACFAEDSYYLRDYDGIEIPKGTFIPAMNTQEISTAYSDEGTPVRLISTNDLYLYETNIIPKETEFFGYIEKVNEPVVGTNGAMVIKITKMKLSDGFELPLNAYVYSTNNNILGGELTKPASYEKMPHYQKGFWLGTTQYVPGPTRSMGIHTVIAAGADLIIIITKPVFITHTLTD